MPSELARLFETTLARRQALKLMAGMMASATLAACGVGPGPSPSPSNLLVLRGKVKDLTGRERERLRAIAAFLELGHRHDVEILGQYWAKTKLIVHGKPGRDFIGDGFDMVVIAKGESAAAVNQWARQWSSVLDIASDEAEFVDAWQAGPSLSGDAPTFLVFERRAGVVKLEQMAGAPAPQLYVAAHHTLPNDRNRQVLVVRAPSRTAVTGWIGRWGARQAIEIVELTDLGSQLAVCRRSTTCTPAAALPAAPAPMSPASIQVSTYSPTGQLLSSDQKLGTFYFRHQATGRFLSIGGGGEVITVATPSANDRWTFTQGTGLDAGNYFLQHQGTAKYLSGDSQGDVTASAAAQTWLGTLSVSQWYAPKIGDYGSGALTADGSGTVSAKSSPNDSSANWEQWDDYNQPSATEEMLQAIIRSTTYDAPWPEDGYSGELLAAYTDILTYLGGQVPKNGSVTTASLDAAKLQVTQKFNDALPAAYVTVFEHLYTELSYFATLDTWYGDGGHVQTLLTETTINNLSLISSVQDKVSPPAGTNVKFEIAAFISLAAIAIAAAGGGPVVGAILAGAWRLYSSATGGANDTLSTTFANLQTNLTTTFNALITKREDARTAVAGNWGKLAALDGMVANGTLTWPSDTSAARAAASRQFEISVWQSVSRALWIISGGGSEDQDRPDESEFLNSPWVYILQVPIQFKPNKDVVSGWATDENYIPASYVPDSLAQHLFDDQAGLGVSMTDFYLGRNGWAIPPDMG